MDVVVTGRQIEVSERFRSHVAEKIARLQKYDARVQRIAVEVSHERNPRQADHAVKVEFTVYTRGPLIRAEAAAFEKMAALDLAFEKLEGQMRKTAERRLTRRIRRPNPAEVLAEQALEVTDERPVGFDDVAQINEEAAEEQFVAEKAAAYEGEDIVAEDGPFVVREKVHKAEPMNLDTALYEMELVGHDFYLFLDKESGKPSVVYRRRGYDYGVMALDVV